MALPLRLLVQHVSSSANPVGIGITGNNFKFKLPNPVRAGNCLILGITHPNGTAFAATPVADTNGTWPTTPTVTADAGTGLNITDIFVLPNAAAGMHQITVQFAAAIIPFQYTISEFMRIKTVSPVNGSSAATAVSGPVLSSGSFTPAKNDGLGGNVIWSYFAISGTASGNPKSWKPGTNFELLDGDIAWTTNQGFPHGSEHSVQSIAAPINPSITAVGDSENYNCVSVALGIDPSAGTEPPLGIRIVKAIHLTSNVPPANATWQLQIPTLGNLLVLATNETTVVNITGITDSRNNAYTLRQWATSTHQIWHTANSTPDPELLVNVAITGTPATVSFLAYDIVGAAAQPFDVLGGVNSTSANGIGTLSDFPIVTPNTNNGLVIWICGDGQGPGLSVDAPPDAIWDLVNYTGELDTDLMENADGKAHLYNTDTSAEHWTFTFTVQVSNNVSNTTVAFIAAPTSATDVRYLLETGTDVLVREDADAGFVLNEASPLNGRYLLEDGTGLLLREDAGVLYLEEAPPKGRYLLEDATGLLLAENSDNLVLETAPGRFELEDATGHILTETANILVTEDFVLAGGGTAYADAATRFSLSARTFQDVALRSRLAVAAVKDVGLRARLSVQTWKDIGLRARLSVAGIKDVALRARISALSFKDIGLRARLSAQAFKDPQLRFRLSARAFKDVALRFALAVGTVAFKDIALRFRLSARAFADIALRFRLSAQTWRDVALRFRVAVQAFKDIALRARISALAYKDVGLRFVLGIRAFKDIALRARLIARAFGDIALRMRMAVAGNKDVALRARLSAQAFKDIALRFRLSARSFKDVALRFSLVVPGAAFKDIALRFRLSARSFTDAALRFRLSAQAFKDAQLRFRLSVRAFKDAAVRLGLAVRTFQDAALRARMSARSFKDIALRFSLIVQGQAFKDIALRVRISVRTFKDAQLRFGLGVRTFKDIALRFRLVVATLAFKDIAVRFRLSARTFKDIATRFGLGVRAFKDVGLRARISAQTFKDVALRVRISARSYKDVATRFALIPWGLFVGSVGAADRALGTVGARDLALGMVGARDLALGTVGARDRVAS